MADKLKGQGHTTVNLFWNFLSLWTCVYISMLIPFTVFLIWRQMFKYWHTNRWASYNYTQKETHKAFVELGILHNLELLFAIWLRTIAKTFDTTTYKKNFNLRFHIVYPNPYSITANMRKYIPKNLVIGRQAQKSHMFRTKTGQSMIRTG